METKVSLNVEQELLVLLSRLTFSEENIERVKSLLDNGVTINWFELYKLALYHKTTTLVMNNLKRIFGKVGVPEYLNELMEYAYKGIEKKNTLYATEIERLTKALKAGGVYVIPVKGAMLIPKMYKDMGVRYSADADFLVRYSDIDKLKDILSKNGYIQGDFDASTQKVIPVSRFEEVKWKMNMSNLYPFVKPSNDTIIDAYKLDFRYALDDTLSVNPINKMIDFLEMFGEPNPAHILTHLCTHFYDEAKYSISLYIAKDMNIIKLCDIREYILQFMNEAKLSECVNFAKEYGLQKQIYFTMFFLKLIYADGYEKDVMHKLEIHDDTFLTTYGENSLNDKYTLKKNFMERLFSCNNADELAKAPKLLEKMN